MDIIDIVLSKKYTDESLKGITGTLAGKNCTVKSATKADGVTTVVFAWTADDGTEKTTTIQVNDGAKGEIGIGIDNVTINANSHLIVTLSDGSTIDAGLIQGGSGTDDYEDLINRPKIEGVDLIGNKTFEDLGVASATDLAQTNGHLQDKVDKTSITTELSDVSTDDEVVGALTAYNELQKLESANKEQFATASGDFITVNDSVDGKIRDLKLYGKSEQKQYSGKNLLNSTLETTEKNGVTCTANGDGTYTLNGMMTGSGFTEFMLCSFSYENGKMYKICGCPDNGNWGKYGIISSNSDSIIGVDAHDYGNGLVFTPKQSGTLEIQIRIWAGVNADKLTFKPMLVDATLYPDTTYDDFEPYTGGIPSPNPSYPQEINSVGDDGSLVVKSCGKNVLKNTNGNNSSQGITYTKNSDGSISCTGTQIEHSYYMLNNDLEVDFKGKYILSGNTTTNSNEWGYCLFLQLEVGDNQFNYIFNNTPDEVVCDFSKYQTLRRVRPYIRVGKNATPLTDKTITFYPMLRPYGTDGTYEPYKESTTTIPLSEPLRSIGDIKDEITYQDGKFGVLRRIKEINLSDLSWNLVNNDKYQYWSYQLNDGKEASSYNTIANIIAEKYMASSWYHTVPLNSDTNAIAYGFNDNTTSSKKIAVHNGSTTESPTGKFLYELVTPTFEPFADQTLPYLSTYDGVTNIFNDDTLSAEMTVKYPTTDASGVGSQNESRIVDIEGTVGSTDISAIGDGTITNAISTMSSKLGGLTFSASGTTLSITDGTNTWTLEANS